jgi:hypothetical protein
MIPPLGLMRNFWPRWSTANFTDATSNRGVCALLKSAAQPNIASR